MHDDQSAQDATRLLEAFRNNHDEAKMVSSEARMHSPFRRARAFVPNWADAEQAGLDRIRRDNAMRWLVDNDMLEGVGGAENRLVTGEGLPDYDFGLAFTITDSGRELLVEIRNRKRA